MLHKMKSVVIDFMEQNLFNKFKLVQLVVNGNFISAQAESKK